YESAASQFLKGDEHSIRPPLNAIPSISGAMAQSLVTARRDGPFKSKDELMRRTGIGQSAVETLSAAGVLDGLPDSAQMDLFEWLG
ncbi:MAG: helix-hairpin-helix domain-containing protein, partial [Eubacteriales bacterium]|nr:helix-hairpin-helix domain-containing protein [Eubacteriales bacterium]